MHLLDSDTLSHLYAGHPRVVANLKAVDDDEVGTTIVTKIEVLRARFEFVMKAARGTELLQAPQRLDINEGQLAGILIVPIDAAAANRFDELRKSRNLRRIGRADLLIASIALANRAVLVTRNLRHFHPIPNLRVVNWVDQ